MTAPARSMIPAPRRPSEAPSIRAMDYRRFLRQLDAGAADLMLTDPPYAISRRTGFHSVGPKGIERFAVSMDFGEWDAAPIDLNALCGLAWRALRKGGTAIVFYDLWKLSHLAEAMTAAGFKQLRLIEWLKTNPVPLNSKVNYLTNSREIAVSGVKGGKPTFNGEYDNGLYRHPIPNNGKRWHPTQKPVELFAELVRKHSHPGDLIIDPFLGGGYYGYRRDCGKPEVRGVRPGQRVRADRQTEGARCRESRPRVICFSSWRRRTGRGSAGRFPSLSLSGGIAA